MHIGFASLSIASAVITFSLNFYVIGGSEVIYKERFQINASGCCGREVLSSILVYNYSDMLSQYIIKYAYLLLGSPFNHLAIRVYIYIQP